MSDEMHATKTEPVLRWQTKEELQRRKRKVATEQQRLKQDEEAGKNGKKRAREIQSDSDVKKGKPEAKEGERWRERRHAEILGESKEVKAKEEEERVIENVDKAVAYKDKLIPTIQEEGQSVAMRSEKEGKRETASLTSPKESKTERRKRKEAKRKIEEEIRRIQEEKRIKEEVMRIKEENRKILKQKLVEKDDKSSQGKEDTQRRRGRHRVSEDEDLCNNNERKSVGEETMSVSISEDTAGWLLGNNCRALIFIKEHCKVSMDVPRRKLDEKRIAHIKGSLRGVGKAGAIVKLDVGQPHLVLTEAGAKRLNKDRSRVEER